MSLRRPKPPIKGGSAPEEEEEEYVNLCSVFQTDEIEALQKLVFYKPKMDKYKVRY